MKPFPAKEAALLPQALHFSLAQGQAQELAPFLGSFPGPLYVLAEPQTGEEADCQEAVAAIGQALARWSLSLTAGLRSAFLEVHGRLARGGKLLGVAGVACRKDHLYGALAGPLQAYIVSLGQERPLAPEATPPLGAPGGPQPYLWGHLLRPGDRLLLAHSSLSRLAPPETIHHLLTDDPAQAIQRLYRLAYDEPRFACLLLVFP